jgi:hypothetical protein
VSTASIIDNISKPKIAVSHARNAVMPIYVNPSTAIALLGFIMIYQYLTG